MNGILSTPWKPTKAQLLAAHNKTVPDLAAKNLMVLFAGWSTLLGRYAGQLRSITGGLGSYAPTRDQHQQPRAALVQQLTHPAPSRSWTASRDFKGPV